MKHHFRHYFYNFALFNAVLVVYQLIYIFSKSSSFISAISLPWMVYLEILFAVFIQIALYFLLTLIQTVWLWGVSHYVSNKSSLDRWQILIFLLTVISILSLNSYFFPLSIFSRLFFPENYPLLNEVILFVSLLAVTLLTVNSFFKILFIQPPWIVLLIIPAMMIVYIFNYHPKLWNKIPHQFPNIIIIGVDSLGPQHISAQLTPNLYQFLNQSTAFQETISPLARTYPAWMSILTGMYPLHHKARYNLMPLDLINNSDSMAWTLKKMGYQTIYATDDRQFNKLSEKAGFEAIIGPSLGVNDILLGTFYDFPLSNLLLNFPVSQWLFPFNYLNRASYFSYYPSSFDQAIAKEIRDRNPKKPLFLAVHYTLAHWPYAWAISSPAQLQDEYSIYEREDLYFTAIHRADSQVGILLQNLQHAGVLENSMIIILSDHGEALYHKGSRVTDLQKYQGITTMATNRLADYFRRKTSTSLEISIGHGSDLLSPSQFHCLLYFKIFKQGQPIHIVQKISNRVGLIDIAPTIYSFLNSSTNKNFDGIPLLNYILNKIPAKERSFILESGELPNYIVTKEGAKRMGKLLYEVNPENNQLQLRKQKLGVLDALKLYAILDKDWLVVLYPDDYKYITVVLNVVNGKWSDSISSSFSQNSPAPQLLKQLLNFYGKELSSYPASKVRPHLLE